MLDPKLLRHSIENIAQQLSKRGFLLDVDQFHQLEEQRKTLQIKMQTLQNERNIRSKEVGYAKAQGQNVNHLLSHLKDLSDELTTLENEVTQLQETLDQFLSQLPNLTHHSVPEGKNETNNQLIRYWGEPRTFSFKPKDHVELGAFHGLMDFETAAKISGSRYVVLRGPLARLHRALAQFMLDIHVREHGYEEISIPLIVNASSCFGTAQLPKFKDDLFALNAEHEQYLISTSEISVTNTVREQILSVGELPIKYVCYSVCFRSEAGSYGKDIRGMIRQHQFEKVELVQIVHPDYSYQALEELTQNAEAILQKLNLPYRVVALCTGDIGFAAGKTYDLEVCLPGQAAYREISSCSNTESFQARGMKARFRDEAGKIDLVHTLNGSGLAVGRTLIAILENYQDELGRIHIPEALQPYMDHQCIIE